MATASNSELLELVLAIQADTSSMKRALQRIVGDTRTATKTIEGEWVRVGASVTRTASQVTRGGQQMTRSLGEVRAATTNLGYQMNDLTQGLMAGTSPFLLMAQQGSQVQQAFRSVGGGWQGIKAIGSGLKGMVSPASLLINLLILGAGYAGQFFRTVKEGSAEATEELTKHLDAIGKVTEKYKDVAPTAHAVIEELRRVAEVQGDITLIEGHLDELSSTIRQKLLTAFAELADVVDETELARALGPTEAASAIAQLRTVFEALIDAVAKGKEPTKELAATLAALDKLAIAAPNAGFDKLAETLRVGILPSMDKLIEQHKAIAELQAQVAEQADRITPELAFPLGSLRPMTSGAGVFNPSQTQMEQARVQREEAERAAKEAQRELERATEETRREAEQAAKQAAADLNEAIVNQTKVAVDAVTGLLGKSETANAAEINAFLKRGGVDLDAAKTAWCAAFVNSALAQVGIEGSGSQVATSFLNWGQGVQLGNLQRGDVLVEPRGRGAGQTGGHVGFATGNIRAIGEEIVAVEMISGNAADQVTTDWVEASDVIARRATDAFVLPGEALKHLSETSKAASAEARQAAEEQARAAEELANAITGIAKTAFSGLINDLRNGVDAGDAFLNMLNRIVDGLINMVIESLFAKNALGGLIGGLLGGGGGVGIAGFAKGGIVGATMRDMQRRNPALWAGAPRFARGGMVGLKPGEVPIIAHRGELVVPRATLMKAARGGTGVAGQGTSYSTTLGDISIDMSSTGMVAANADSAREFGIRVQKAVQQIMVVESRPGGILRRVP